MNLFSRTQHQQHRFPRSLMKYFPIAGHIHLLRLREVGSAQEGGLHVRVQVLRGPRPELSSRGRRRARIHSVGRQYSNLIGRVRARRGAGCYYKNQCDIDVGSPRPAARPAAAGCRWPPNTRVNDQ